MAWRGNINYKCYNPNKPNKYHIKFYKMCEAKSGYCINYEIYTGKKEDFPEHNSVGSTIDRLMDPLKGDGYHLYTDRFYSSPKVFLDLHEVHSTNATGTVIVTRSGLPKQQLKKEKKLKSGDLRNFTSGPLSFQTWKDKREVNMLTTVFPPKKKVSFIGLALF